MIIGEAVIGSAETLGFWNFCDGTAGSDVSTVANSAGSGSFTSDTAQKTDGTKGVLPTFNSDSPGRIWSGKKGELLCANPQSIDFRYVSRETRQGGYIDLTGVADAISGKGDFTIEYFFRMNPDYVYWQSGDPNYANYSKTMLYLESRSGYGAFKIITPENVYTTGEKAGQCKNVKLEVYQHAPVAAGSSSFSADLCDGKWHHIAIVYTETNSVAKTGKLVFWYDRAKASDITYLNDPNGETGLKLRIGSGYRNQKGDDKTSTEPVNASISALRVSDEALASDDFLQVDDFPDLAGMGTAAYYEFREGAVGAKVGTVTNAVDSSLMPGVAGLTWNGSATAGELPKFAAEVPAKRIYTDSTMKTLLTENYQSVFFRSVDDYNMGGGKIDFTAASTLAHRLDAFTFEYFFKLPAGQTHPWRSPFGYRYDEKGDLKVNLSSATTATGYGSYACEVRTNSANGTATVTLKSISLSSANLGSDWHHAAFVRTNAAFRTDVYLDGAKIGSLYYTNALYLSSAPFRLGSSALDAKSITEACGGYFACPRLVTRALAPEDFMVASNLPSNTVFAVNFNDGAGKDGQTFVSDTATSNKVLVPSGTENMIVKYGLHAQAYPQFAEGYAVRAGRRIEWGAQEVWKNLAGCHFLGYGSLPDGTAYRNYAGTELCVAGSACAYRNPESWTMEAFVKPQYDNLDNTLLFAKAALANQHGTPTPYPCYCWMLTRNKDGTVALRWTERAEDPAYVYTADSSDYYKSVATSSAVLKDHRWYHVALSYDKPTRTFKLYVNYTLVLTQSTDGRDLFDSQYEYFFSRINASLGFEGWMDEIRFSSAALEPEAFERYGLEGLMVIFR